jgi:hypothetical protein
VLPLKVKNVDPPDSYDMQIEAFAETEVHEKIKTMVPLAACHNRQGTLISLSCVTYSATTMWDQKKCLILILFSLIILHLLNFMKILAGFKFTTLKICFYFGSVSTKF